MPTRGKNSYSIQSVDNALDLLEALSEEEGEIQSANLCKRLGMNKASLFRYLATFESRGYVEHDKGTGKYRLGLSAYEIGQKFLSRMGLLRKARPVMERMVRECDETVYIAVRRGSDILFLDMVDTSQQVKIISLLGKRYPANLSAPGRVLLAFGGSDVGISGDNSLTQSLLVVRRQGYCLDCGGLGEGITSVAVPLFATGGKLQAALSISGPDFRLNKETIEALILPRLQEAGVSISSRLGYFA